MSVLFPDIETLNLALAGGIVPPEVAAAPVRAGNLPAGTWVSPSLAIPDESLATLERIGVNTTFDARTSEGMAIGNWPQIIPLRRLATMPDVGPRTPVLFEVRDLRQWPAFVSEMLRLGCDRMSYRVLGPRSVRRVLLKTYGPPYYALLQAIDPEGPRAPRAYLEISDGVWIEFGFTHQFAKKIRPATGQMLLLRPSRDWETIADAPFHDLDDALEIAVPEPAQDGCDAAPASPFSIPLTLAAGDNNELPSMWVLSDNALTIVDEFVRSASPAMLDRFAIAIAGEVVVLRLRPSRLPPPGVALAATAYRSYLRLPNLFLPLGTRLQPPLRRETIRKLLADDPVTITWLKPGTSGSFMLMSIADDAFRPLSAWIDNVLDWDRAVLTEWARSTEFAFAGVVIREETPAAASAAAPAKSQPSKSKTPEPEPEPPAPTRLTRVATSPATELAAQPSELRAKLTRIEQQFIEVDGALDHPERQKLWPTLARLNSELHQPAEAALSWAHALWEADSPADAHLWAWVRAERALAEPRLDSSDLERLLKRERPAAADVRALAGVVTWAAAQKPIPPALRTALPEVQSYLFTHDHLLPIRVAWLAWSAWCRAAGGDVLTLVRTRDRMLTRLFEGGLNAEVDLPTFLRFAGRADADRLRHIREWVEDIRIRVRNWALHDLAGPHPTAAYIDLMFAFGLARLGAAGTARELMRQSTATLGDIDDDRQDAHVFLAEAFSWRIEQLIAGRPHGGPLPAEQLEYLVQMYAEISHLPRERETRRTVPYAVERMREQSRILEPHEKFDPNRHIRVEHEAVVREAALLPDLRDLAQLPGRINDLIRRAGAPELLIRVLAACVRMAGRLGADPACRLLERVGPAIAAAAPTTDSLTLETRLALLERSLFFAAHFDRADLVSNFVERLLTFFESGTLPTMSPVTGQAIGQMLRSLRKLGLRDQSMLLLERIYRAILRNRTLEEAQASNPRNWPKTLQMLLNLVPGWLTFNQPERSQPVIDAARRLLNRANLPGAPQVGMNDYVSIVCSYVNALGFGPPASAREQITALFTEGALERLPNTFTVRDFYSWFHLNVAEAVVLTLASDDFTLGPAAKRWLDDDEYLVRRRIHRDVRAHLERGG